MPPRSRYAVDPSLIATAPQQTSANLHSTPLNGQPPSLSENPTPNAYAPSRERQQVYTQPTQQNADYSQPLGRTFQQPTNHIPPPPHSSGPSIAGPRTRIDPSQVPDPVEAQELDQNLYDDDDFLSCQPRGLMPMAGTDYRGIDQGNSLPRHIRPTLMTIPANSQLLDTTALPFGVIVQPFAPPRYDEAPVPLVSNWVSGQSAFDQPSDQDGPPRCEKCRGYINPWVKFTDGGQRWTCNLCNGSNTIPPAYYSHLTSTGHRIDHQDRPELLHGTVDFAVPQSYWATQPAGSLVDAAEDRSAANLAAASDVLSSTASDLLGGLNLGSTPAPTRGPSPAPGFKEREKERKEMRKLRCPRPMGRVFVIDVSGPSVHRGIVHEACEGIRRSLYGNGTEDEEVLGTGEKIAIVTVAETIGFWNLSSSQPSLLVVSDLDDMYCPLFDGFLVDPVESRPQIEKLLAILPPMMENQSDGNRIAAGSAVKGALAGLRLLGGQINLFLSGLPTIGSGKLSSREDPTTYNTDKEKALFSAVDAFWRNTAEELAESGVGVNLFLFPEQYCDIASVGTLSAVTGGETFFHPKFQPVRDRDSLYDEIKRVATRETVYNVMIRIRCSNGLRVANHLGNFYQRNPTDLELGTLDDSKAFAAVIKHENRLDDRQMSSIQVAVLYTTSNGQRRVRCLNLTMASTSLIGNVFRFADLDASVTLFVKDAISQMPSRNLKDIRKTLADRCNKVLLMYRRHCAPAVQAGQLILPEGFKLLPLYTLCMLKSKPLKGGNVTSDVRSHYQRRLLSHGLTATLNLLYPRMLAIHDLAADAGFPAQNGRLKMPQFMRASYAYMVAEGAYLLSNGEVAMVWLGNAISPQIVDDLYGVESIDEVDVRMTRLPNLPTLLSTQLRNILTHLERIIGHTLPVMIVRQNLDGLEIEFANSLVEDSNNDALSYTDYLMTAHKAITNELSGGKSDSWRPW